VKLKTMLTCFALVLTVGVSTSAAGSSNSGNAAQCQHGGWQSLTRSNSVAFRNTGDCVSYAAQGGAFASATESQRDCESFGGSFSTDPATDEFGLSSVGDQVVWTCNARTVSTTTSNQTLQSDCQAEGGNQTASDGAPHFTCARH
jgi:hypothetical protein